MNDIFISYDSSDRSRVEPLVRLLKEQGWSVWWDRTIPIGKTFDEVIEGALDASKCVVVVWSKESIASKWVKTEAAEGAQRNALVPILLDNVKLPLEFRRIQAAQLFNWNGDLTDPEVIKFLDSVAAILGNPPAPPQSTREAQPASALENTEGAPSRDSINQGKLLPSNPILKAGFLIVLAMVLIVFIWMMIPSRSPQPSPPVSGNANVVNTNRGTVTVFYLKQAEADVQKLVKALQDQGYTVTYRKSDPSDPYPSDPDVRWYYSEDEEKATKEISSIINKALNIVAIPRSRVDDQVSVKRHSKGEFEVRLN